MSTKCRVVNEYGFWRLILISKLTISLELISFLKSYISCILFYKMRPITVSGC